MHAILRLAALVLIFAATADAQQNTTETWPELDVYWRPAVHQRTFLELSSSAEREGTKHEGTVGLYQDYLQLPGWFFRGGFRYTFSLRDASYREERLVGEVNVTAFSSGRLRLVNRTRVEGRRVNGDYSYRIRDRLHFQRLAQEQRGLALAPYGTLEAYYDSRYNTLARIGGRTGTEARIGGPATIDVYVARVSNSRSQPRYVNALGLTVRLSFK